MPPSQGNSTHFSLGQIFSLRPPRALVIYYSCRQEGHMVRDYWKYNNFNYTKNHMIPSYSSVEASLAEYYNQQLYMNSRALSHVTSQRASLELLHDGHPSYSISTANGASHPVFGIGSTTISPNLGEIKLPQVLYILALYRNLISVGSLVDRRHAIVFTKF